LTGGQVYNAASGIRVTINELASNMLKFSNRNDLMVRDIMNFDIDDTKVRKELGVSFQQDFWETLQNSL
tara:strand:- start:1513 stop:1719 length:207 start_codon:yes stop_codon:yes gene_type:complete